MGDEVSPNHAFVATERDSVWWQSHTGRSRHEKPSNNGFLRPAIPDQTSGDHSVRVSSREVRNAFRRIL
jgi:ribosomal protein L4